MHSLPFSGRRFSIDRLARMTLILFISRALAEIGSLWRWPVGTIIGGLIGLGLGWLLLTRLSSKTVPLSLLLLWLYILSPGFSPSWMLFAVIATGAYFLIEQFPDLRPNWPDAITFVVFLILYWLTLSPGLLPADAGEFQMVAANLGVAHPPGYPLYILLGKLFTLIIPNNPMRGLNLFSAVTTALTVVLVGRAARTF